MYAPDVVAARPADRYDWASIAAREIQRVELPEGERESFAAGHTLRQFYCHARYGLESMRRQSVTDGTLAQASLVKDLQAINRWERYSPRPRDWPSDAAWEGRPLAWITDQHATEAVSAMREGLAAQTVRSTWSHLRTIFHRAVEVKAIERAPEPEWGKDSGDRASKQLYSDPQLTQIYLALADHVDLQVAFVVSVNVGPRSVDLFSLRWSDFALDRDRQIVEYTARKTGKRHTVPLAAVTVAQLQRWRRASGVLPLSGLSGLVWPELTDATASEPEQSRPARRRNRRIKAILRSLKLEADKPWQVGRLTCNERLERHMPGAGQFVLGHSNTLNSVSYREPSGLIYEAVTTLPQPACFGVGCLEA